MRPANLVEICLLEFASTYSPAKKYSTDFDQDCDSGDEEEQFQNSSIRLTNATVMKMRKRLLNTPISMSSNRPKTTSTP